jgi:hypothetical protein
MKHIFARFGGAEDRAGPRHVGTLDKANNLMSLQTDIL